MKINNTFASTTWDLFVYTYIWEVGTISCWYTRQTLNYRDVTKSYEYRRTPNKALAANREGGKARNTNLALTEITIVLIVTFSLMCVGPYTLRSHRGGLLFRSTTSNSISTSAYDGGSPQSEALTRRRYFSCYIHNTKAPEVKL